MGLGFLDLDHAGQTDASRSVVCTELTRMSISTDMHYHAQARALNPESHVD